MTDSSDYAVLWATFIEGTSPEDAVRNARLVQLDPHSAATTFVVCRTTDLYRGPDAWQFTCARTVRLRPVPRPPTPSPTPWRLSLALMFATWLAGTLAVVFASWWLMGCCAAFLAVWAVLEWRRP